MNERTHTRTREREFISRCIEGSSAAWDELLERYGGLVFSVTGRYSSDYHVRGELFIHILENLWDDNARRLKAWRGESRFSTYLYSVGARLCGDYFKKRYVTERRKYERLDVSRPGFEKRPAAFPPPYRTSRTARDRLEYRECGVLLENLIRRLSEREQTALALFYREGMNYAEIATIIGVTENNVGHILSRARKKLHAMLGKKGITKIEDLT